MEPERGVPHWRNIANPIPPKPPVLGRITIRRSCPSAAPDFFQVWERVLRWSRTGRSGFGDLNERPG
jgi:hypothetical protein